MLKQTGLYEGEVPIYHLYYGNTDGRPRSGTHHLPDAPAGRDRSPRHQSGLPSQPVNSDWGRWLLDGPSAIASASTRQPSSAAGSNEFTLRTPAVCRSGWWPTASATPSRSWDRGGVSADHAILGSHGMTIDLSSSEEMIAYLENGLGAVEDGGDDQTRRWRLGFDPHRVGYVELVENRDSPPGTRFLGEGTVHHCAWDVPDSKVQTAARTWLESLGYDRDWLGPRDRGYFVSVYNRTPSGALFELAWSKPQSWTVDEAADDLGHTFKIPPMFMDSGRHDHRLPRADQG